MNRQIKISTIALSILMLLTACAPESSAPTPDTSYLEEELAAEAFATASSKNVQTVTKDLSYAEIARDDQTYLAFWFMWNGETAFLPIAQSTSNDLDILSCMVDPNVEIAIGKVFSGLEFIEDECVVDVIATENLPPTIIIPRYFEDGIKIYDNTELDLADWNVIDLNGEFAENFADVIKVIVKNDLIGSGDLVISIYRKDGPNGDLFSDANVIPTYTLPAEKLQIHFTADKLANLEYVDDVIYALEREFTWQIPAGYPELNLFPGDENWFVLKIEEVGRQPSEALIQIKGVGFE